MTRANRLKYDRKSKELHISLYGNEARRMKVAGFRFESPIPVEIHDAEDIVIVKSPEPFNVREYVESNLTYASVSEV